MWRNLWTFIAIYAIFFAKSVIHCLFCREFFCHNLRVLWRKIEPKSTFVEKMTNMRSAGTLAFGTLAPETLAMGTLAFGTLVPETLATGTLLV